MRLNTWPTNIARTIETKGRFGSADPRIEAIQTLKRLNREIYYAAAEVQPAFVRIKQWMMGSPPV